MWIPQTVLAAAAVAVGAVLLYTWGLYPLLLRLAANRARRRSGVPSAHAPAATPSSVAIVFSAHNEEPVIRARIENLLAARERLLHGVGGGAVAEILVGIDGSTDRTTPIAAEAAAGRAGIRIRTFEQRRGKLAVIKQLVSETKAAILVFTDANAMFEEDAMERLIAHFADPKVGGVCGRLILAGDAAEETYWNWETRMKRDESDIDSCLGANGAIYAIRRELFWETIPDNTAVDDFVIGMKVREHGFRMLHDPEAVAREDTPEIIAHEWVRRVRIGAGDFQALWLCRRCLLPHFGLFAWMFLSHKALRWLTSHLALFALLCAVAAAVMPAAAASGWRGAAGMAAVFTARTGCACAAALLLLAVAGWFAGAGARGPWKLCRLCYYFLAMNAALFAGSFRAASGNVRGHWQRTPRSA